MEFWDQTVETTKKFFSAAEKKTEEFVNVQKLNYKISNLQSKLKTEYAKLGESMCNAIQKGEVLSADAFSGSVDEINSIKADIAKLKDALARVKGKISCPNCKADCDAKSSYCDKCGSAL